MLSWFSFAIALTSINVFSGLLSMLCLASMSGSWGSDTGFPERASGALLRIPLTHSAVKLYPMILVLRHWSRGFSISSRQ